MIQLGNKADVNFRTAGSRCRYGVAPWRVPGYVYLSWRGDWPSERAVERNRTGDSRYHDRFLHVFEPRTTHQVRKNSAGIRFSIRAAVEILNGQPKQGAHQRGALKSVVGDMELAPRAKALVHRRQPFAFSSIGT
ncbi:hypothetical protein KEU06_25005 [Pseudaminobacter sp. 19-2017]|uniref:Uncharacterized protein n=1 Tax=Pseudaminobacter soli (ex Zhang et al. 2022) TaxID=2831468 RepID=A0A942I3V4_9HYPH|nr:hypothetical protein [Pseudaminobacter soli]MBS3651872.1 hypothetical protein [Pseudaminobacter soli]